MLFLDPLADQKTEPDVEGNRRVPNEFLKPPDGVEIAFLDHVRRIDAPSQPRIQPQYHHPAKPGSVVDEQLDDGGPIPRGGAGDKSGNLAVCWCHIPHDTSKETLISILLENHRAFCRVTYSDTGGYSIGKIII